MKSVKMLSVGVITLSVLAYSCGGGGSSISSESTTSSQPAPAASISLEEKYKDDPVFIAGSAKAKEAGCTACHMIERKIVGPSYADVAAKYDNTDENVAMLTATVINGNVGNWGEVPMPAHPHLAKEDVETIIKYVLLLKK
ncbi:c-type cytochrome [Cecembia lonarensis]|uniref:Cytochrome c8 n=1 Tax=Cecembia lonarensis (strain CCUG 58316 / KCTC 22772 / LW9) TaxID=1225176 RepID=K1LB36_CECL9|nr:c-type cytochrome [Cecembia lonarensis]EKB47608.1 Cytochrome c8 [Cecembia lonarensis LW9]